MNGNHLLEAMSFVDEKYIAEADSITKKRLHWQPIAGLAAAACAAVLLLPRADWFWGMIFPNNETQYEETYSSEKAAKAANDSSSYLFAAPVEITVRVLSCEDGILLCSVVDPGTAELAANTELRIAAPAQDSRAAESQEKAFLKITIFPDQLDQEVLYPQEIVPIEES